MFVFRERFNREFPTRGGDIFFESFIFGDSILRLIHPSFWRASLQRFKVRIFFFAHTCPTKFHKPGLKRKGCKGRAGGVFLYCL